MTILKHTATKVVVASLAASLVLTGCGKSIQPEAKKPVKLIAIDNPQVAIQSVFSQELANGSRFKRGAAINKNDVLDLQLASDGARLIAASKAGTVQSFEGNRAAWTVNVGEPITSGVGADFASQVAIVTTRLGNVIALDTNTGAVRWKTNINATVLTPAVIAGNRVLLSANDGVLHGLNLQSGALIWQFGTQQPNVSVRGTAKPLRLDGSTALFATADGRIHAIASDTGEALWTRRIGVAVGGSDVGRMSDVDGTPLVVGKHLYVTSFSGNLAGFDMSTGRTLFTVRDFPTTRAVAHLNGVLIGADTNGLVQGFNAVTGEKLWKNNALTHRKPSNPVTIGNFVAIGDYEGVVHLFNVNGDLVGRAQSRDKGQIVSLQVLGNRLYAQTSAGYASVWQVQ